MFSSLTIEIDPVELRASFGPGWTVRRVALSEIASSRVVQNPWYYGWGIRITPHEMVYNVSGTLGVEVRLRNGSAFRLGTDEPEALQAAIAHAIRSDGR